MADTFAFAPLTDYLRSWLAAVPPAGLAVGVTDRGRTLYTAGLGYADLSSRRPVLADTTFQIGSIGKSMTALAVLQLVESGRLDLDAPFSTHLPWFAMPSRFGTITLRHVLSHTAGLPSGADFTPAARYEGFALRETEAAWEPGSRYHYSNTGYKLLGWMLEDIYGGDYGSIIEQRVLQPLGMTATHGAITHATHRNTATGYVPLHDDRPFRQRDTLIPATWIEYVVGDGSPVSTAGDMARYARLWLNRGRGDDGPIVSPSMYDLMTSPAISMAEGGNFPPEYNYCLGIISHQADGHHFIGHGGSTVGFRSIMITDQTDGLGVVMMCNGSDVNMYPLARHALRFAAAIADGATPPEPPESAGSDEGFKCGLIRRRVRSRTDGTLAVGTGSGRPPAGEPARRCRHHAGTRGREYVLRAARRLRPVPAAFSWAGGCRRRRAQGGNTPRGRCVRSAGVRTAGADCGMSGGVGRVPGPLPQPLSLLSQHPDHPATGPAVPGLAAWSGRAADAASSRFG